MPFWDSFFKKTDKNVTAKIVDQFHLASFLKDNEPVFNRFNLFAGSLQDEKSLELINTIYHSFTTFSAVPKRFAPIAIPIICCLFKNKQINAYGIFSRQESVTAAENFIKKLVSDNSQQTNRTYQIEINQKVYKIRFFSKSDILLNYQEDHIIDLKGGYTWDPSMEFLYGGPQTQAEQEKIKQMLEDNIFNYSDISDLKDVIPIMDGDCNFIIKNLLPRGSSMTDTIGIPVVENKFDI